MKEELKETYNFKKFDSKHLKLTYPHVTYNAQGLYLGAVFLENNKWLEENKVSIFTDSEKNIIKLESSSIGYKISKTGERGKNINVRGLPVPFGRYKEIAPLLFELEYKKGETK